MINHYGILELITPDIRFKVETDQHNLYHLYSASRVFLINYVGRKTWI